MLQSAYKYAVSDITMLRDDATNPANLPTRKNILSHLNIIVSQSMYCSEIWIHYSGHGLQVTEVNRRNQIIGIDDAIAPMDYQSAGFILDTDIYAIIKNIKCRAFLIFDSCHSASVCSLPWLYQYSPPSSISRTHINNNSLKNQNIFMISGCKDNQTSADEYDTKLNEWVGAMTEGFLTSLEDNNYGGSIIKIYTDTCNYIIKHGFSQQPCFSSSSNSPNYTLVNPHVQVGSSKPSVQTSSTITDKKSIGLLPIAHRSAKPMGIIKTNTTLDHSLQNDTTLMMNSLKPMNNRKVSDFGIISSGSSILKNDTNSSSVMQSFEMRPFKHRPKMGLI